MKRYRDFEYKSVKICLINTTKISAIFSVDKNKRDLNQKQF